jgi:microcystin-dependent protein
MAPSGLNDSGRAVMAAAAKYRDDISGAIATGGTSTAYTVSSYQGFDTLAHLDTNMIAFTPHTTNGATVTLNVDGLGAKPLRSAPSVELPAGVLIQGTPYLALYNNSDAAFYLHGFFANPYVVPIGVLLDFGGSTAPNSSFVLAYGQAISRSTYSALFSMFGTTFGTGDGSTTFNIPDLRGRVVAGRDDMGGSAASRLTSSYFGGTATNVGAVGGAESKTLLTANLPPYTPSGTLTTGTISIQSSFNGFQLGGTNAVVGLSNGGTNFVLNGFSGFSFTGTAQGGTSTPFATVQPTIIMNKLLRVI